MGQSLGTITPIRNVDQFANGSNISRMDQPVREAEIFAMDHSKGQAAFQDAESLYSE
jgi:hypothetical protein